MRPAVRTEPLGTSGSGSSHDPTGLRSEHNILRYVPIGRVLIRVGRDTPRGCPGRRPRAAALCGVSVTVSDSEKESDDELLARLGDLGGDLGLDRVRMLTQPSAALRIGVFELGIDIDAEPVSSSGRRELRRWLREQAVSRTAHRHGRVAP